MLDRLGDSIDAVVISTPDHTHAVIAMEAIRRGKHVYCEKPLAHSIAEARAVALAAREQGVQTQMGNQGHSSESIRLMCEWVWDGAIGEVRQAYAWSSRPGGGAAFAVNMERPADEPPPPAALDWDLWLGPAPYRPYHPDYLPFKWRGWVDFGTGALGDMGCHILDPMFWALKLGEAETVEVEATTTHQNEKVARETFPVASIVRYAFPARGGMPPLKLTWFDGALRPPRPDDMEPERELRGEGGLLVGENGNILHGSHGASGMRIVPETKMKAYALPEKTLPRSQGHHKDWILACKGGQPASANFDYGGPLAELALLGVLAQRNQNRKLVWDAKTMRIVNDEKANAMVTPAFRDGWHL
ncbi:MAG: 1,5-anhydro-D-fructose reductase [candidate division BRC1 bacterium ADurb.BinA364]|nr:MAG: 1,5-anhydro-D-fructose reductase [candidate division BRC1 bacterium ADurb.BinA364]